MPGGHIAKVHAEHVIGIDYGVFIIPQRCFTQPVIGGHITLSLKVGKKRILISGLLHTNCTPCQFKPYTAGQILKMSQAIEKIVSYN